MILSEDDFDFSAFAPKEVVLIKEYLRRKAVRAKGEKFIDYVQALWPWFIVEAVHVMIADYFEKLLTGEIDRLMINMPPRTGKSVMTSEALPAWWIGHFPTDKILHTSYALGLVEKFGRKIRNSLADPAYQEMFPGTRLAKDSKASAQWATAVGGEYNAAGLGGGVAGKGWNLGIIDDPTSEQDAFSKTAHDNAFEWYGAGFYTRRQPDRNAVVVTQCMTGDTPVLMASGIEKPLRHIQPGDEVATYENGALTTTRVAAWRSNGIDAIYTVHTRSGRILRANERHPFLVEQNGERKWVRLRDLTPGLGLVLLKGVLDLGGQKPDRENATLARPPSRITKNTLMRRITRWGIMVSGKVNSVLMKRAQNPLSFMDTALHTTRNFFGWLGTAVLRIVPSIDVTTILNGATGLQQNNSTNFFANRNTFAPYVNNPHQNTILAHIGTVSYASITTTQRGVYEGCCVTTATSQSDTQRPQLQQMQWRNISNFTVDRITAIVPDGREEVFDVEIERTENFIANGFVSHNTRWRTDDLTGRLLEEERKDEGADKWTLLKIPAILDEEGADMLNEYANHPAIKVPCRYREGDSFAPQRWPLVEINRTINQISRKAQASLYRQSPTEEEGSILLRKWWQVWEGEPPKVEFVIQSYDTAFEESERNDFSARTTWGVFKYEKTNQYCAILLEAMEKRLNFPDLRQNAWESYQQYKPDRVIVEKKASGHSLIQELRKRGVPITASQAKGSKESRMDTASVPLEAGNVYYFDTRWANAVVDHCAVFPNGPNDDLADSVAHALIWLRKTFHLDARSDRRFDKDAPEDDANEKFAVTPQRSYAVRRTGTRMRIGERHG